MFKWLSKFIPESKGSQNPYEEQKGSNFFMLPGPLYNSQETATYMESRDRACYQFAKEHPLVKSILNLRQSQPKGWGIPSFSEESPGWRLETIGKEAYTEEDDAVIQEISSMLLSCGTARFTPFIPTQTNFRDFLAACVRSLLVYNKVFIRIWRQDKAIAFGVVNPNGVAFCPDNYSPKKMSKERCAFVRYKGGNVVEEFEAGEALLYVRRVAVEDAYPDSEVYQAQDLLMSYKFILFHNMARFESDRIPRGLLALSGVGTQDFLNIQQEMSEVMDAPMRRKPGESVRYPSMLMYRLGDGGALQWLPLDPNPKDMDYMAAYNWLLTQICSIFGTDPAELGLGEILNPVLSEASPRDAVLLSREKGLYPLMMDVQSIVLELLNMLVQDNRYIFRFTGLYISRADINLWVQMMDNGLMTPREILSLLNKPAPKLPDNLDVLWDMPTNPASWLPNMIAAMMGFAPAAGNDGEKRKNDGRQ